MSYKMAHHVSVLPIEIVTPTVSGQSGVEVLPSLHTDVTPTTLGIQSMPSLHTNVSSAALPPGK